MGKLGEETAIEREVQERKDEAAALSGRLDEETQRSSANLEEESKTLKSLAEHSSLLVTFISVKSVNFT